MDIVSKEQLSEWQIQRRWDVCVVIKAVVCDNTLFTARPLVMSMARVGIEAHSVRIILLPSGASSAFLWLTPLPLVLRPPSVSPLPLKTSH